MNNFCISLKNNDFELFKAEKKVNIHTHGLLSSNRALFFQQFKKTLPTFKDNEDIMELSKYINDNLSKEVNNKKDQLLLYELTIKTALYNGVTILVTDIDYRLPEKFYNNNALLLVEDLKRLVLKYKNKIKILFNIGISRHSYKKKDKELVYNLIDTGFFYGIDLFGDELSTKINKFKRIYRYAKKKNLILTAHVGEYGDAKSILKAIKILKLNQVNHGINIIYNEKIMKKISKKNIIFNVCPISNVKLKRVSSLANHPIKIMIKNNLKVTINTDDELIFENSLFEEYKLLYKEKTLNLNELNEIRMNGLNIYNIKE